MRPGGSGVLKTERGESWAVGTSLRLHPLRRLRRHFFHMGEMLYASVE